MRVSAISSSSVPHQAKHLMVLPSWTSNMTTKSIKYAPAPWARHASRMLSTKQESARPHTSSPKNADNACTATIAPSKSHPEKPSSSGLGVVQELKQDDECSLMTTRPRPSTDNGPGGEATFSVLKRKFGLHRLRRRTKDRVTLSIFLAAAALNVLRMHNWLAGGLLYPQFSKNNAFWYIFFALWASISRVRPNFWSHGRHMLAHASR